jgi:hypothetical protein
VQVNGVPREVYVHDIKHVDAYGSLTKADPDVFAMNGQAQTGSGVENLGPYRFGGILPGAGIIGQVVEVTL